MYLFNIYSVHDQLCEVHSMCLCMCLSSRKYFCTMCCTIVLCQVNHSLKNYRERYTILPALNFKLALCLNNVFA